MQIRFCLLGFPFFFQFAVFISGFLEEKKSQSKNHLHIQTPSNTHACDRFDRMKKSRQKQQLKIASSEQVDDIRLTFRSISELSMKFFLQQ